MAASDKTIQLFQPSYHVDECLAEIRKCLEVGWTGLGFKTVELETAWKAYTGLPHAHFVSSATAGLHLALAIYKAMEGWQDGDEILTTPLTFVSTNHAILYERLTPVFADIDATLCLDPRSIEARITKKTRAVMYVGMGGNAGRLREVEALCRRHKLRLILDAAHMDGTRYEGKHAGHGIDCTVFSFQAVKNLATADSGMICFAEAELDAKARVMSWLGINKDTYARSQSDGSYKWQYDVEHVGFKAHGNSVVAAIGLVQLKYLDEENARRRALCARYEAALSACPAIRLPEYLDDCVPSRHLCQIRVPAAIREELITHLHGERIFPGVHYTANTRYRMYASSLGRCPEAERADQELVSLPLHLRLSDEDAERVAATVRVFVERGAAPLRKIA